MHSDASAAPATSLYDLIIIGAGCSGLALARELAQQQYRGKVLILDAKSRFVDDRTWCYWAKPTSPWFHMAEQRWFSLQCSDHSHSVTTQLHRYAYCRLSAIAYYHNALAQLKADNFCLLLDHAVKQIRLKAVPHHLSPNHLSPNHLSPNHFSSKHLSKDAYQILTECGKVYHAAAIIDCRASALQAVQANYYQSFVGQQLLLKHAIKKPMAVQLMSQLQSSQQQTQFIYVLPISERELLVEPTVFGASPVSPQTLLPQINQWLHQQGLTVQQVLRQEQGVLPMGQLESAQSAWPVAGIQSGALRASTGYGFLSIQQWAVAAAAAFIQQGCFNTSTVRQTTADKLDRLFIRVLAAQPERGAALFMQMAMALPGDRFARFMSEQGRLTDWLRVIAAMPKSLFLQQCSKDLWYQSCTVLGWSSAHSQDDSPELNAYTLPPKPQSSHHSHDT